MESLTQRLYTACGLLVAALATVVVVQAWLGERSLAEGHAAQRRGEFSVAAADYRAAGGRVNADAAVELARLQLLRRDWAGAAGSLHEAMALAPTRGLPHLLQAQLEMDSPGPWDDAREKRILGSCTIATALEPNRAEIVRGCETISRRMGELPRRDGGR